MAQAPKQTYDNYHKAYYQTERGRAAHTRAKARYRRKIAKLYGIPYYQAIKLHKENLAKVREDEPQDNS